MDGLEYTYKERQRGHSRALVFAILLNPLVPPLAIMAINFINQPSSEGTTGLPKHVIQLVSEAIDSASSELRRLNLEVNLAHLSFSSNY